MPPLPDNHLTRFIGLAILGVMLLGTVFYAFTTIAMP